MDEQAMNDWNNHQGTVNAWPIALKANSNCCEEAAMLSESSYVPCNRPASSIVGWKERNEKPIRMCNICADHNVKNRNGEIIRQLTVEEVFTPLKSSNPLDAMSE